MASQDLFFNIFARDQASGSFTRLGRAASGAADDVSGLGRRLDLIGRQVARPEIKLQDDQARIGMDEIRLKLARLSRTVADPKITVEGYLRASLEISRLESKLNGVLGASGGAGGAGASGLLGITSTLPVVGEVGVPAMAGLAVAAAATAAALAPVIAALIPVTLGFGTLAAVAGPELSKVFTALGESGKKLQATLKTLTPAERDLLREAQPLKDQFHALAKAVQPEIMKAFGEGIKIVKQLMPALKPLAEAAAKALDKFLTQLSNWLKSPGGQHFIQWLETVGPKDIKNFGRVLWDIAKGVGNALYYIYKTGSWIDRFLTHWHDNWVLVKDTAELQWDQIKIGALKLVYDILGAFTHIPIIGGEFRKARDAIGVELGRIRDDTRRAVNEIQAAWNELHGKKVSIEFTSRFVAAHGVPVLPHHAAGTPGAAPGWAWVGEKGPELVKFGGGETVLPHHVSRQVARGYAAGAGWDFSDVFSPSAAATIRMIRAGVRAAEDAGIGYVRKHPLTYWAFTGPGGYAMPAGPIAALARRMFPWPAVYWPSFNNVEMREAGWNMFARNPTSGAYGLAQFIGGPAEYYTYGGNPNTAAGQLIAMFRYIAQRYGNPLRAWEHETAVGWYGNGLDAVFRNRAVIGVGDKPERVQITPLSRRGGGGPAVIIHVGRPGGGRNSLDALLTQWILHNVWVKGGGDVQVAFGGT